VLEDVHRNLSLELTLTSDRYKVQVDCLHSDAPWFEVGDFIWLLCRNATTTCPCTKLDYKNLGLFKIIEKIGPRVVLLELPSHFHIHNVFHVSLLERCHLSRIPGRHPSPPPFIQFSSLSSQTSIPCPLERVPYLRSNMEANTPSQACPGLVRAFYERYPQKQRRCFRGQP
jgi:hypothetical protein